jgi:hypothetical protein
MEGLHVVGGITTVSKISTRQCFNYVLHVCVFIFIMYSTVHMNEC